MALLAAIGVGVYARPQQPRTRGGDRARRHRPGRGDRREPAKPAPTAAPTVTPSATAEAALPAEVELTIDATPKVVDVYLRGDQDRHLGGARASIKRGDAKVKLTFKAAGYAPQDVEVPAAANTVVAVTLKKIAAGKRGDLEF